MRSEEMINCFGNRGSHPGEFTFVSGVRFDDSHNMLIANARDGRLQVREYGNHISACVPFEVFEKAGRFATRILLDAEPGYVSDIHVNQAGQLMTLDRRGNAATVYQLMPH